MPEGCGAEMTDSKLIELLGTALESLGEFVEVGLADGGVAEVTLPVGRGATEIASAIVSVSEEKESGLCNRCEGGDPRCRYCAGSRLGWQHLEER